MVFIQPVKKVVAVKHLRKGFARQVLHFFLAGKVVDKDNLPKALPVKFADQAAADKPCCTCYYYHDASLFYSISLFGSSSPYPEVLSSRLSKKANISPINPSSENTSMALV